MRKLEFANLIISGDDAYERETVAIVERIARTRTGQAVITKIRAHGWIVIEPFKSDKFNAFARHEVKLGLIGSISFSASTFANVTKVNGLPMPNYRAILYPGFQPDDVLLHEMVHAGRVLGGDLNQIRLTGAMAAYDDEEEFFAVMVANIYLSEKGGPSTFLRASHGLSYLTGARIDSDIFLHADDNFRLIEKYCRQHPKISRMLAEIPCKFNPVRSYFDNGKIKLPPEDLSGPQRNVANEARPALTDDYLIGYLQPRFQASDVAGYGARARKLEEIFGSLSANEAIGLFERLIYKKNGDLVAGYFHNHLSTATRDKLLTILRARVTSGP